MQGKWIKDATEMEAPCLTKTPQRSHKTCLCFSPGDDDTQGKTICFQTPGNIWWSQEKGFGKNERNGKEEKRSSMFHITTNDFVSLRHERKCPNAIRTTEIRVVILINTGLVPHCIPFYQFIFLVYTIAQLTNITIVKVDVEAAEPSGHDMELSRDGGLHNYSCVMKGQHSK